MKRKSCIGLVFTFVSFYVALDAIAMDEQINEDKRSIFSTSTNERADNREKIKDATSLVLGCIVARTSERHLSRYCDCNSIAGDIALGAAGAAATLATGYVVNKVYDYYYPEQEQKGEGFLNCAGFDRGGRSTLEKVLAIEERKSRL